ncbi:MAG: response regulator [Deltaproteobacteria bacterium]|nr:response regulator [Deltaproteobacteria bacterium]
MGKEETILLVEDSATVLALVRAFLQNEGYDVLSAGSGKEAVRICREFAGRIALVLTDMIMPNMGGVELAGQVRAMRPGTKVLFMSGYAEEETSSIGAPLIQKPFTPHALAAKLREILDAPP